MPHLLVVQPRQNSLITPEQDFKVSGAAFDRGWPEPILIDQVLVTVDNGSPISATLSPVHRTSESGVNFEAQARVSANGGQHTIKVTAINDQGRSATQFVTVYVGVGPLNATFTGVSTLMTTDSRDKDASGAPNPHVFPLTATARFSADRRTVELNLPPIQDISQPQSGVTLTIEVNVAGGGTGSFDPSNGSFVVPVTLRFRVLVQVDIFGGMITVSDTLSTLPINLTTASSSSPTGAFMDNGVPMDGAGNVVLVGDGQFSGGVLNGQDASLVVSGTVSPHP